ncbi:RNA polymerase sigma factor [Pedobacter metabolipauper]|uniref:RNA polymerase sigma-70 factor (ECF subfamily) n=1 Tax=Pedobacter metabolipauper TaxID=425513 RepID=A0A4R6SSB1_9SPHI|nr:sigma-70 family RNA polymerase sigma factor [Pedobacter metabolipauper]TDQ08265.1 RNA polymerase sigma-70 factor (ECF subfamily) [Pedobacter metabolipauper]
MNSRNDKELLDLVRVSDTEAYAELYNRFWKSLYTYALKKIGDEDDAFDLVQELFIELWDRRGNIPEITVAVENYLHGSVFFKLAKYFRTKGFREQHQKNFEAFLKHEGVSEFASDPLQILENELQYDSIIQVIHTTIDQMPGKMKEIFIMSRSGQYSISEIAEQLNVSPQTVKNQVSNALLRLRKSTSEHNLSTAQLCILTWLTIS